MGREAMQKLIYYDYPCNIRELENIIQRAIILSRAVIITENDIQINLESYQSTFYFLEQNVPITELNRYVENIERQMIEKALRACGGKQSKAAELLNIPERTLRYKMPKYLISKDILSND